MLTTGRATVRYVSIHTSSICHGIDHYLRLGIPKDASVTEIKNAFIVKAKSSHPDLNQNSNSAAQKFCLLRDAYECLRDETKRAAYDGSSTVHSLHRAAPLRRRKHAVRWKRAHSRAQEEEKKGRLQEEARERRMAKEFGTTVAEVSIRNLIHDGQIGKAIGEWSALGAPLELCEFMLEQYRLTRHFPTDADLKAMLDALHASEVPTPGSYTYMEELSAPSAVAVFVERKTHIYNALICVANRVSTVHTVLKIVDEMARRGVEKDAETLDIVLWAMGCGSYGDSSRG